MSWPPTLPDHLIVERWRPIHPEDLAELRAAVGLGDVEAIECIAVDQERHVRELVTALRPISDAACAAQDTPQRREAPSEVSEAIRRAQEAHRGRQAAPRGRGRKAR